jgi:hypothetical protein
MSFGKRAPAGPTNSRVEFDGDAAPAVDPALAAQLSAWPKKQDDGDASARAGARVNLTLSLIARFVLLFGVLSFLIHDILMTGDINQIVAAVAVAMLADYARVLRKALRSAAGV